MARETKHTCRVCGKTYSYCSKCQIRPITYKENGFCSDDCSDIFVTLSKHGCHLATAKETLAELGNIEGKTFTPSIQAHIDAIKAEIKPEEVIIKETVAEEKAPVLKKKKWQDNAAQE